MPSPARDATSTPSSNLQLQELQELNDELEKRRSAVFGLFKRSEHTIQRDISTTQERRTRLLTEIDNTKARYSEAKAKFETAKAERDRLHTQLSGLDRSLADRIIAAVDKSRAPLVAELREIEIKISELRTSVVKEAKVLGTTCTKAYLAVKEIGHVGTVIIDEASMVLPPMAWFVAGLAKERVIVSGDFRQIPPIVQTVPTSRVRRIGARRFHAIGIRQPATSVIPAWCTLDTQYRMDKAICELISEPNVWTALLKTALEAESYVYQRKSLHHHMTEPSQSLTHPTSGPFESVNAFYSRFNLMHALLARNLAWHLHRQGIHSIRAPILQFVRPMLPKQDSSSKLIDGEKLDNACSSRNRP